MDGSGPDWGRLARFIQRRREELGLSVRKAASLAEVDRGTWADAEEAKRNLSRRSWSGFERALQWQAGSIEAILAAGEPQPAPPGQYTERGVGGSLADEIERIQRLSIDPKDKIRIVNALVDIYEQDQESTST